MKISERSLSTGYAKNRIEKKEKRSEENTL